MTFDQQAAIAPVETLFNIVINPTPPPPEPEPDPTPEPQLAANNPPAWPDSPPLSLYHVVPKTIEEQPWSYNLPQPVDPELDVVTVTVNLGSAASFMTFEDMSLKIENLADAAVVEGSHTVTVTLDDGTN